LLFYRGGDRTTFGIDEKWRKKGGKIRGVWGGRRQGAATTLLRLSLNSLRNHFLWEEKRGGKGGEREG